MKHQILRGRPKAGQKWGYPKELDDNVLDWLLCMREFHLALCTQMLHNKALTLIKPQNLTFKASDAWARKLICLHNLVLRAYTSVAQKVPDDLQSKIAAFDKEVEVTRQKHDFPKELIGNMDKTAMYF